MLDGGFEAVTDDEDVVDASQMRELARLLGRKRLENEILKEALELARSRKDHCVRDRRLRSLWHAPKFGISGKMVQNLMVADIESLGLVGSLCGPTLLSRLPEDIPWRVHLEANDVLYHLGAGGVVRLLPSCADGAPASDAARHPRSGRRLRPWQRERFGHGPGRWLGLAQPLRLAMPQALNSLPGTARLPASKRRAAHVGLAWLPEHGKSGGWKRHESSPLQALEEALSVCDHDHRARAVIGPTTRLTTRAVAQDPMPGNDCSFRGGVGALAALHWGSHA